MIKFYYKTIKEPRLQILKNFQIGSWVFVESPNKTELRKLAAKLKLDFGLLNDGLDPYEVPRVEKEENKTYVFTRIPYKSDQGISTMPLLLVVAENFVLSLSKEKLPLWKNFLEEKIEFFTTQKIKLFFQIFVEINQVYRHFLTEISKEVRHATGKLEQVSNREIMRFVVFENTLNDFLAALVPTNTLLNELLSGKYFTLYEKDEELMEDLFLAAGQLIENCKANLKNIVNIRDTYSTIMTNNLNRVIKLLTALTIILTIPTIIASFYGMNVNLPLAQSSHAFWLISAFTVVLVAAVLAIFAKNKWL
jgi:magnesium transporter